MRETIGSGTTAKVLDFVYDNAGRPFALIYTNGTADPDTYYYVLNIQGDVVALMTADRTIVAEYTYNAWGKILSATGTMADINPIRYRGYYYDTETGFYYLQSRYYDPANHRFINADGYYSTGTGFLGYNMFAYCNNNPVLFSDSSGQIIEIEDDATEEEIAQYERAVAYIKTTETGRALIERLENSSVVFTVIIDDECVHKFVFGQQIIYFNPYSGILLVDNVSVQSAAIALAHEMGHAAQYLDGKYEGLYGIDLDINLPLLDEACVIMYETPIAKELGEPIRNKYLDGIGAAATKNSTHYRTVDSESFWGRIMWKWFGHKIARDHNLK